MANGTRACVTFCSLSSIILFYHLAAAGGSGLWLALMPAPTLSLLLFGSVRFPSPHSLLQFLRRKKLIPQGWRQGSLWLLRGDWVLRTPASGFSSAAASQRAPQPGHDPSVPWLPCLCPLELGLDAQRISLLSYLKAHTCRGGGCVGHT